MRNNTKNKALWKEWSKIEDANLFESFEEFADFYYTNGQASCFRKYTNYPWSKENFFFGTYEDLMEFYKTNLEIPFYMKEKIGSKVNNLTIKEIYVEKKNGKSEYFAKCICDCGQETVKSFEAMNKGNARTCGCHFGKGKNRRLIYIKSTQSWN